MRKFMFFFDYILPFPLFGIMLYLWYIRVGDLLFASYVLALPLLWGYIVPGIGTNVLKLWRFEGKWRVGNFYYHHGVMYAGPMALIMYITFGSGPVSMTRVVTVILCTAGMQGFLSGQHDVYAVKSGHLFIDNPPAREGKSPEEIVNYYNPKYFFLLGGMFGGSCVYAYQKIVIEQVHTGSWYCLLLVIGLGLMGVIPSVPFLVHMKIKR